MQHLAFRDPNKFVAGQLHRHVNEWAMLLGGSDDKSVKVLDWIMNGIE